ncbi:MAG: Smr/MutS family protein [Deltaproteobacteria bacterium]|nr:Smr/MutS family protein [Deltaproteobacteria bacterium]
MGKKRKKSSGQKQRPAAKFANRPFAGLKLTDQPKPPVEPDTPAVTPHEPPDEPGLDDDARAMAALAEGTELLEPDRPLAEKRAVVKPPLASVDDSELVMRELDDLVHGTMPFDFAGTDEYIEAAVQGLDHRLVKKLKRAEFSVQAHLDLHGYNRHEARQLVAGFVDKSQAEGKRCVLIVHGRGLGSKDNIPVLKQKLAAWLTRGAIGRKVLAYTSARPYDGGTGAVYVLLRA